ncbi:unnamed protein product [Umbelopsis sp. WA50703]
MHYKKTGERMIPASSFIGLKDLTGYTVLVTGANSGIGYSTSCVLACLGANINICVRSSSKAEEAKKGIVKYVKDHAADQASTVERRLSAHLVEMSDFASVRSLCEELQFPIDILINNAGLQRKEKQLTNDGYELTWQVNYLCSTFLMTKLLLPRLEEAGKLNQRRSRVINISSGMHKMVEDFDFDDFNFDKRPYGFVQAYTQSKLAQILNVEYYTNVVLPPTISSTATLFYCVEPGSVKTNIYRQESGFEAPPWDGFEERPTPDEAAYPILVCIVNDNITPGALIAVPDGRHGQKSNLAQDTQLAAKLWAYSLKAIE